ncbi:MAG: ThuA domain-containing protein [Mariniphaga sp.]|nr:ThuA domain-containing protein [Mariniphaga sp.]
MNLILRNIVLFSLLFSSTSFSQELPSLKDRKVMVVYGGWPDHEPKQCVDVLLPWLEAEGAKVDVYDNLEKYADKDYMSQVDLIIQTFTMSNITRQQESGLLEAIKNGAGIAGWHGGIGDAFRQNTEFQFMVGGQWVAHPGGVIDYEVNITNKKDAVTKGLSDFKMHSEQYYMHVDPNVKVMATTTFSGDHADWIDECVMPVVWKKTYGKGRVFYSSLVHVASDFEVHEALEILKRGIRWSSASKYEPKEKWVEPVY